MVQLNHVLPYVDSSFTYLYLFRTVLYVKINVYIYSRIRITGYREPYCKQTIFIQKLEVTHNISRFSMVLNAWL